VNIPSGVVTFFFDAVKEETNVGVRQKAQIYDLVLDASFSTKLR